MTSKEPDNPLQRKGETMNEKELTRHLLEAQAEQELPSSPAAVVPDDKQDGTPTTVTIPEDFRPHELCEDPNLPDRDDDRLNDCDDLNT